MSIELMSEKGIYNIKKLDNDGHNYSTWSICCKMVLLVLNIWDVVDPSPNSSTHPTSSPGKSSDPDPIAEWDKKNGKALSVITLLVDDTLIHLVKTKEFTCDAWKALSDSYNGISAQDTLIIMSRLH